MAALVSKQLPRDFFKRTFYTRFLYLIFQVCCNNLIPDHQSDAFESPLKPSRKEFSLGDKIIEFFLSGFTRWDGQYFLHISMHGYTHENCLAFFPLFPLLVKGGALLVRLALLNTISNWHARVLSCFLINTVAFLIAAKYLFLLTLKRVGNRRFAIKTWELFTVSPVTVFFMACYSESLFSAFTFSGIYYCAERRFFIASVLFSLSGATRSNGTLNLGFLIFFMLVQLSLHSTIKSNIIKIASFLPKLLIAALPFASYQFYAYITFCNHSNHLESYPIKLQEYLNKENLVATGSEIPSWCHNTVPFSYSAIQEKYWNVGFLRYFELKQTPNFLLALPAISLVLCYGWLFLRHCPEVRKLCSTKSSFKISTHPIFAVKNCAFVCHATFLALFTFFCAHVQISTRLIGSSSPAIYWFMAWLTENESSNKSELSPLLPLPRGESAVGKLVRYYCLTYLSLGLLMFSNGLPWT